MTDQLRRWRFGSFDRELGRFPLIMGVLNVTPDSFSDGGQHNQTDDAVAHALQLVEDGADIIDIGGESTRPDAQPVSESEEIERTIPVIERLVTATQVPISIDTTKSTVAKAAIEAGAVIVNDISGLTFDQHMVDVCAESNVGVICMHIQGTPQTMQADPRYDDLVAEICKFFDERLTTLGEAGINFERIAFDPGIGFGKTAEHNIRLLSAISELRASGRPLLIGHSRKRFLAKVVGRPIEERLAGTIGVAIALAAQSTDMIRVHDVRAVKDALLAWSTICDAPRNSSGA
jgi:dihydropteroate synthase